MVGWRLTVHLLSGTLLPMPMFHNHHPPAAAVWFVGCVIDVSCCCCRVPNTRGDQIKLKGLTCAKLMQAINEICIKPKCPRPDFEISWRLGKHLWAATLSESGLCGRWHLRACGEPYRSSYRRVTADTVLHVFRPAADCAWRAGPRTRSHHRPACLSHRRHVILQQALPQAFS